MIFNEFQVIIDYDNAANTAWRMSASFDGKAKHISNTLQFNNNGKVISIADILKTG